MQKKIIQNTCFLIFITFNFLSFFTVCSGNTGQSYIIPDAKSGGGFPLVVSGQPENIWIDGDDFPGVIRAAHQLQNDLGKVAGNQPQIKTGMPSGDKNAVIIGTIGKSELIDRLIARKIIDVSDIRGKWESTLIQVVDNPFAGVKRALVIAGSDKRGTIFGIYDLSAKIGVSPWYWWADVPVRKHSYLYVNMGRYLLDGPKVKYRGIFLNDEAPALSGWAFEKFGGFNHQFYEHVFELILRLKGNFLWPAMWGSAFYDDDPLNPQLADEYGVVIGTSHHEPMMRAHDEWRRYGTGQWNYEANPEVLKKFWREGIHRKGNYESLVTVAMRGDGDAPMSESANIALLEKIISDQRTILEEVTGKPAEETPQVWALYKEVQDYYDKGMRVPDDVTLLLCDDNWGNVRKLPDLNAPHRKGGYGMYYHFDYVGGPRNYKWINVSQVQRIWEQMNLAYSYGVDKIWIVNVGDLKPMEYPISFFLDMAWDPGKFNTENLFRHTIDWCAEQFGAQYGADAARIVNLYTKYNRRVTPELLNEKIFSLGNYKEFETVVTDYRNLLIDAMRLYNLFPDSLKDSYDQLVLFPVNACSNLYEMYYAVAKNHQCAASNDMKANYWADVAMQCFGRDSLLTIHYNHQISDGKWNHLMDQVRIGYTYWQQPARRVMPQVVRLNLPDRQNKDLIFVEGDGYVSMEAGHFNRAVGTGKIKWKIIPDLGKTESGITVFPPDISLDSKDQIYLEYNIRFKSIGEFKVDVLVSPTLNFNADKGLRYGISFNGGEEQIVNINQKFTTRELENWQATSINKTSTRHKIIKLGLNTLRFRVLDPGIVLQKIIIDTGGLKPSYLGPPESERTMK